MFNEINTGKRRPNQQGAESGIFTLPERESLQQFFELLVLFNQTKDMKEKAAYFGQLARFRQSKARTISEGQHLFFTRWYYAVIWNYFGIDQRQRNPAAIAKAIHPLLTEAQVSEAIELLLNLGLIKKLSNGYAVTEHHLKTESEFRGLEAMQYNQ